MAGAELTTIGREHSDRLSGLIYLDAGADPAFFPWSDPEYRAVVQKLETQRPAVVERLQADRKKSYEAYRAWQMGTEQFSFCEAEVRNMYDMNPDGSIGDYRTPDRFRKAIDEGAKKRDYSAPPGSQSTRPYRMTPSSRSSIWTWSAEEKKETTLSLVRVISR